MLASLAVIARGWHYWWSWCSGARKVRSNLAKRSQIPQAAFGGLVFLVHMTRSLVNRGAGEAGPRFRNIDFLT